MSTPSMEQISRAAVDSGYWEHDEVARALAAHDAGVRAAERAKRPDRGAVPIIDSESWGWGHCIACGGGAVTHRGLMLLSVLGAPNLARIAWCEAEECIEDRKLTVAIPVTPRHVEWIDSAIALESEAREEPGLSGILARAEEVRQDDGWGIGGAWGDYGEVVVPLRILSYVIEGELDQKVASTDPGFALTYAEQVRRAEEAEAKLAEAREEPTWQWKDRHGDIWTPGEDGLLHSPETATFPREHVEKKWGPLVQVSRAAPEAREIPDAEVAAAYSAFVQASFGFPGTPAMRAALEAAREVSGG